MQIPEKAEQIKTRLKKLNKTLESRQFKINLPQQIDAKALRVHFSSLIQIENLEVITKLITKCKQKKSLRFALITCKSKAMRDRMINQSHQIYGKELRALTVSDENVIQEKQLKTRVKKIEGKEFVKEIEKSKNDSIFSSQKSLSNNEKGKGASFEKLKTNLKKEESADLDQKEVLQRDIQNSNDSNKQSEQEYREELEFLQNNYYYQTEDLIQQYQDLKSYTEFLEWYWFITIKQNFRFEHKGQIIDLSPEGLFSSNEKSRDGLNQIKKEELGLKNINTLNAESKLATRIPLRRPKLSGMKIDSVFVNFCIEPSNSQYFNTFGRREFLSLNNQEENLRFNLGVNEGQGVSSKKRLVKKCDFDVCGY
jgi:hypothetical protein